MTKETLLLLKSLLERVTISAAQPDFHETYRMVAQAMSELEAAISEADDAT